MPVFLSQIPPPPPGKTGWPWNVESAPSPLELPPGQSWPKISIVTPSFNQGAYLEKTIRSVLLQGYSNLEYIIIDGGSTDNSLEIIRKYEPWLTYWVSEQDRGQSHAINKGFERATGELLGWLNSDDWYAEGALFKLARAYLENPSAGALYGQGYIVNSNGKVIYTPTLRQVTKNSLFDWCYGNDFMQPSCLLTSATWARCGPLDEDVHFALDVDLWLKVAEHFAFNKINDVLSFSLSHEGAKTTVQRNRMYVDLALVILKHGGEKSARRILDDLADRGAAAEEELSVISRLPLARKFLRFSRKKRWGRRSLT